MYCFARVYPLRLVVMLTLSRKAGAATTQAAIYFLARCRTRVFSRVLGEMAEGAQSMQYAIFCYHREREVESWSKAEDDAVMAKLAVVQDKLIKQRRLGPVARLMPTTAATTLHKDREPHFVVDGPFAETKEQLLGFFIIDCKDLADAIETAKELGVANPGGSYEIRPLQMFYPGVGAS
jgi:hypothetical protein